MKRTVFSNGSSLVVTLPYSWVKRYGIKAKDELDLKVEDQCLQISTLKPSAIPSVDITTKGLDRTWLRVLVRSAYRKGYDRVTIFHDSPSLLHYRTGQHVQVQDVIKQEVSSLIGFEIIDQSNHQTTIQTLSMETKDAFKPALRRVFLIFLQYLELIETYCAQPTNTESRFPEKLEEIHDQIERLISYCLRILNRHQPVSYKDTTLYFHILSSIDLAADIVKYSGRELINLTPSKHFLNIVSKINSLVRKYYELFYSYSQESVVTFSREKTQIMKLFSNPDSTVPSSETCILFKYSQLLEIFYLLLESCMGLHLSDD